MKIKVQDATLLQLDYLVAVAEGATNFHHDTVATYWVTMHGKDRALAKGWAQSFTPTTDWAQGGPIIERDGIDLYWMQHGTPDFKPLWQSRIVRVGQNRILYGPTPLIAAMRCFVSLKLGDEVEVPDEVL